jgi:hypothetical protein
MLEGLDPEFEGVAASLGVASRLQTIVPVVRPELFPPLLTSLLWRLPEPQGIRFGGFYRGKYANEDRDCPAQARPLLLSSCSSSRYCFCWRSGLQRWSKMKSRAPSGSGLIYGSPQRCSKRQNTLYVESPDQIRSRNLRLSRDLAAQGACV